LKGERSGKTKEMRRKKRGVRGENEVRRKTKKIKIKR